MSLQRSAVLAHVTESRMRAALDDPVMADSAFAFDAVSRAAQTAPGSVWQPLTGEPGHPVLSADDPLPVLSVSVWQDYPSLHAYVFGDLHGRALLRRSQWFDPQGRPVTAGRPGRSR